jgi:site-specific recombinase XerD
LTKTQKEFRTPKAESSAARILIQFKEQLEKGGYSSYVIPRYASVADQFLSYLETESVSVTEAWPSHVTCFLNGKLDQCQRRIGRPPKNLPQWRTDYTAPVHLLLRMVHPHWPPLEPPANEHERFQRELCEGYGQWLTEVNGLSRPTLRKNVDAARMFLHWLKERGGPKTVRRLNVSSLDAYLAWRMPELRRATRHGVSSCLRSFLRYLHAADFIPQDLSQAVSGPVLYQFDDIPRAFSEKQVETLLRTARLDHSAAGRRDYAILMLLAIYGLRAGEVVRLRLEDIDWREERFRVRQSKSGRESFLPLVASVGEAMLKYLQKDRPQTEAREVFLCLRAPYRPFFNGSSLHTVICRRLGQAGIQMKGRHGSHAFRFACAGRLMHAKVPLKAIGDLLGHRSATSTEIYLRLSTDDLRAVSLELPGKENSCRPGPTKKKLC